MTITGSKDERVWVFQADRFMTNEEEKLLSNRLKAFTDTWQAHGVQLNASFDIRDKLFVILKNDETVEPVSGCSIDNAIKFFQAMEAEMDISFFNRMLIACKGSEGIKLYPLSDLQTAVEKSEIDPETYIFDNTVINGEQFKERWIVPLKESWVAR